LSIRRNTIYNLFGSVLPLALSLVTIPIYIGLIGEARYGVLAIAWLMLGYFGLFDLGLGRATAQRIAVLHDASAEERAQTFWTALTINVGLGILGGLLIWPVAVYFFGNVFKIEDVLRHEIQSAVPWLILAVPMATLSGVLTGALQGRERFLELNLISILGTILFQLLPLAVAAFWDVDLGLLLPAALFARIVTLIVLFVRCQRHIVLGHPPSFMRGQAGQLIRFGGWVTVTSFVGPLMVILDRFIIGAILGAKAVAYYTVPFQLAERSTIIPNALITTLFPRFAAVDSQEEKRLAVESLQVLITIMTPLIVIGILFIKPFLIWWVGAKFAEQSALVGQIILLGFWANGFARVPYAQLQARGKPDLVAKCHLVEVLPYLILLYLGVHYLGLVGAALAFSIRVFIDLVLLTGLAGNLRQVSSLFMIPLSLLAIGFLIAWQGHINDTEWRAVAIAHISISMFWAWKKTPDSIKAGILARLKPLFQ